MNLKGIRGINTFIQPSEPTTQIVGDVWVRPGETSKRSWDGEKWNDIVLGKAWGWGPGSDYGYVCGGTTGGNETAQIHRIIFPFDSGIAPVIGSMTTPRGSTSSCNSSNYGYVCAGLGMLTLSTIDRITFPFDSGTATHVGNLSGTRLGTSSYNSSNYGYTCGGSYNPTSFTNIERITFPFDSGTASHVGNLTVGKHLSSACNSSNYGYICGGSSSTPTLYSTIERITFPFDSGTASNVGNLAIAGTFATSSCNSSNYGYICGESYGSVIERITFPFDSGTATHVGNLSQDRFTSSSTDGTDFVTLFGV